MNARNALLGGVVLLSLLVIAGVAYSGDDDDDDDEGGNPAALAQALPQASVTLEQALKASEREGNPISAKFEMGHGALQLSVYTTKGDHFEEVIVDHRSGAISKAGPITEGADLKHAKEQKQALATAKTSLYQAVQNSLKSHAGYRAVSVVPHLNGGQPVAEIDLMKGAEVKEDSQKL